MHPCLNRRIGARLRRALKTGGRITTPPWHGIGTRRCLIVRFHHTTNGIGGQGGARAAGSVTFELQPRQQGNAANDIAGDGFGWESHNGPGSRGAEKRRRYTFREKASVGVELRELEETREEVWIVHGMTPQHYLQTKTGISNTLICKWQRAEDEITKNVEDEVTALLLRKSRTQTWFPKAEKELYAMLRQWRKTKSEGVYNLEIRQLHEDSRGDAL